MKTINIASIMVFAVGLLTPRITSAQGTITYLSGLSQPSTGSVAVGSDSWVAAPFFTGANVEGYSLDSVQLAMMDASGSPSGFTVMIYANDVHNLALEPGISLGTLSGSLNPVTSGIYTYTPVSSLTLLPSTPYFIVVTAGTAIANGAYELSYAGANSYNPSGGWFSLGGVLTSSDGSSWPAPTVGYPQFAITATPVPEPGDFPLWLAGASCLVGLRCWRKFQFKAR